LITNTALEAYAGALSIAVAVLLLTLLVTRELLLAAGGILARRLARAITIAAIPLLIGFGIIATLRFSALATPGSVPASPTPPRALQGSPTAAPSRPAGASVSPPLASASPTAAALPAGQLVRDTFDEAALGLLPQPWTRQPPNAGVAVAAFPSAADRSLALSTRSTRGAAICRQFRRVTGGTLEVHFDTLARSLPAAGVSLTVGTRERTRMTLTMLPTRFAYRDGARTILTANPFELATWYRIMIRTDTSRRHSELIVTKPNGTRVLRRSAVLWQEPGPGGVDRVCVNAPSGASIYFDDLGVGRVAGPPTRIPVPTP
jgi:hypothetical protein